MLLPSLRQLEYLIALADYQHFGQAAEHCRVTPSTLSAGIRDLEDILGVALAERSKRQVVMTAIGMDIAQRARILIRDASDLMTLATANHAPMTGIMRLGVIPTVGPYLLPKSMTNLKQRYPDFQMYLDEEFTAPLLNKLRDGKLDAAIIALPFDIEDLEVMHLFEDEFQFACHHSHPLSSKKKIRQNELKDQPLMLLKEGHCLRGHALSACSLGDYQTRAQFEASSLSTLVMMVDAGLGVTLLPKLAINSQVTAGTKICLRPLENPASREIGLVWRASTSRREEFKMLAEVISESITI